jgi:membrane protease subunit (stomatin/prohibitin family)
MGLMDKLRGELVDIIEWIDDSQHTLVWRFPRYHNQIKNGAKLIVRPGQQAVFVHGGQLADVFGEGTHDLKTDNLPILSTIMGWKYGFDSPFKAEVYFVRTSQITDLKWGTPNPIMLRDADFGPIRLRAFGTYVLKARDPKIILRELVGTDGSFEADELNELMRSLIAESFTDLLGESKISALDLAANYRELGASLVKNLNERIDDEYGLEVPKVMIVNVSLPEAVEKALDTRTSMGVIGNMQQYQQYQMANAMPIAAANTGSGGAGMGMGMGMGLGMAHQMMNAMAPGAMAPGAMAPAGGPPPLAGPPPLGGAPLGGAMFHVNVNGASQGPYTVQQVASGVSSGTVGPQTMVWTQGMAQWMPAGQVPALAQLFSGAAPPPPPPAGPPPLG